jgi:uncharacterized lipoprotein YddW (UPF0748 family)
MTAKDFCRRRSLAAIVSTLCLVLCFALHTQAQRSEYRGFWVDTFNTTFNNHSDVVNMVIRAKLANANVIFAQVRRRGDAWYITPLEPKFAGVAANFDPLADLITVAHAEGIEVHAYVIMGAVHLSTPTPPSINLPPSPLHVFNQHSGYDPVTRRITPGPNNWLTRTLLPDSGNAIGFQGHKIGSDFWIDFGHPDAAAYTVDVLMHLVNNYNIDGLHLDRIRYPELTVSGQTPATGTNIGYNAVSVQRFNTRYNRTGNPTTSDPLWTQWRRDQVSNIVRRLYLNVIKVKPHVKVSGSLIAFGGGPVNESDWNSAEAYWRVYQDWRSWTEEGIIDIAVPMNYKREHLASQATQFQQWTEWTRNHQYNRSALIGLGGFLNPVEGTLRQVRASLSPSTATANTAQGVVFFSMENNNTAATDGVTTTPIVNPFAIPPSITGLRSFQDFASGLKTGGSTTGTVRYESQATYPVGIFNERATIPVHQWKIASTKGHLMGFARRADNTILDAATVTIENLATGAVRTGATDGGGFYGGVDLDPGNYRVRAQLGSTVLFACSATVVAGVVTTADLTSTSSGPPTTTATVTPADPDGENGWYVTSPTLSLDAVGGCAGLARTEYSLDNGATWQTYDGPITITQEGTTTVLFRSVDQTGTIEPAGSRTFMVDLSAPSVTLQANPSTIFPPNGKMVDVSINGTGGDAGAGVAEVSYVVTDEYGMPLSIATRALSGGSATWVETLAVEARRNGGDRDGRLYTITATITDAAGRTSNASTTVTVLHDRGR